MKKTTLLQIEKKRFNQMPFDETEFLNFLKKIKNGHILNLNIHIHCWSVAVGVCVCCMRI